ncbi:DUF4956 domain-containing protein [candidate division KSB1 bacterium]|nr:DUF4956 domain-containing protein [candidate division KSB1 bacterium]
MIQTFEEFLSTSRANIPILGFIFNILLSAALAVILSWIYAKYGNSLSNRKQFGKNFLLITMTTMLIITIVKSSLALSLGLVGALSIIRFRAAIKEPEELAYLFLAIAVGLGFGANQTAITIIAFIIMVVIVIIAKKFSKNHYDNQNLHLTIQSSNPNKISIENILEILKKNCDVVDLRRFDETKEILEASFMVEARDFTQLSKAKEELQKLNEALKISFLDNKGLM